MHPPRIPLPNWFIAFPVREAHWLPQVLEGLPTGLRAFHPADLHLTLAFLGPVREDQARRAWALAQTALPKAAYITFERLEAFGGARNPTAFSFTLRDGREILTAVLASMTHGLQQAADARLETRAPRPHVTIARPGTRARGDLAVAAAAERWREAVSAPRAGLWLRELSLFTWAPQRQERLFQAVETARLPEWDLE